MSHRGAPSILGKIVDDPVAYNKATGQQYCHIRTSPRPGCVQVAIFRNTRHKKQVTGGVGGVFCNVAAGNIIMIGDNKMPPVTSKAFAEPGLNPPEFKFKKFVPQQEKVPVVVANPTKTISSTLLQDCDHFIKGRTFVGNWPDYDQFLHDFVQFVEQKVEEGG